MNIAFIHNDNEEKIMDFGAERLGGQEMHLISLNMYEWIVHSQCVALSNKQNVSLPTACNSTLSVITANSISRNNSKTLYSIVYKSE